MNVSCYWCETGDCRGVAPFKLNHTCLCVRYNDKMKYKLNLHEPFMLKWQKLWNTSHTLTLSCIKDFTLEQVTNCCKKYGKLLWEDTYLDDNIKCICNRINRYFTLNDFNAFVMVVMMYKEFKLIITILDNIYVFVQRIINGYGLGNLKVMYHTDLITLCLDCKLCYKISMNKCKRNNTWPRHRYQNERMTIS